MDIKRKQKYVLILISIAMMFIMSIAIFSGCAKPERVMTIDEAVKVQALSSDYIKNVAALRYGSVNTAELAEGAPILTPIEYEVIPVEDEISDKVKNQIIRDFKSKMKQPDDYVNKCDIKEYYGTYNGYIIVEINYEYEHSRWLTYSIDLIVSDIYLGVIPCSSIIVAWKI